jgi:hypothetical protein
MRTVARSVGYGTLLVVAFATAWTAGALAPTRATAPTPPTVIAAPALTRAPAPAPAPAPATDAPVVALVPTRVAEVDGYQVRLDGDLTVGAPAQVFATVSRSGAAVTDLEPHDGAFGRLVGVRAGDLAPAHVHPDAIPPAPTDRAGPGIAFTAEVPGSGPYRLVLDFRHAGAVHTVVFTLLAG